MVTVRFLKQTIMVTVRFRPATHLAYLAVFRRLRVVRSNLCLDPFVHPVIAVLREKLRQDHGHRFAFASTIAMRLRVRYRPLVRVVPIEQQIVDAELQR